MASYGFGPTGANAVKVRPTTGVADPYNAQTWFQDATAAGKKDGTIINSAWLNQIIAERLEFSAASGVAINSNIGNDDFLLRAVVALITQKIAATALTAPTITAMLDAHLSQSWRTNPDAADIITLLDAALGTSWRTVTQTDIDTSVTAAINALKGTVGGALDTLEEIEDALGNDPNLAATLTTLIANETATRAAADTAEATARAAADALLVPFASIINDLTTGGTAVPLSAQQGVALKAITDALTTALAAEATTRATNDTAEATARAAADTAIQALITALTTLSGMAAGSTNLGSFTGSTIADNVDIKVALQALETAVEAAGNGAFGTMALQNAIAVAITGGAINGTAIGTTTPALGTFTDVSATGLGKVGTLHVATTDVLQMLFDGALAFNYYKTADLFAVSNLYAASAQITGSATIGNDLTVTDDVTVGGDIGIAGRLAVAVNAFVVDQLNKRIGTKAVPLVTADFDGGTDAIAIPRGTTAQRPAAPLAGYDRWNTTTGMREWWDGAAWVNPASAATQAIGSII